MNASTNPANHICGFEFRIVLACLLAGVGTLGLGGEARGQDLAGDKQALVALYNATDGENWVNNGNWLSEEPLDEWYGVTVSDGRVTGLELSNNQLTGAIPTELGDLSSLLVLDLSNNQLTGFIPQSVIQLSLAEFYFHGNPGLRGPPSREPAPEPPAPEPPAPEAPMNLAASVVGVDRIDLSWSKPSGSVTAYSVEWSADGKARWTLVRPAHSGLGTTYSDTGLEPGTTRYYRVQARNSRGAGDWSKVVSATTLRVLNFAHFANGDGIASEWVFVSAANRPA